MQFYSGPLMHFLSGVDRGVLHKVREVVFDLLRSFGMTTIFGNPGSTELPMFRDFPADFRDVLGLQEMVAIGMADGCLLGR
jgi:benzoylformate decarboxylase